MSGHSKWATIKRKKAATDSKRGKMFNRLLREVQIAAKIGGGSLEGNPRLKSAVAAARSASVPTDNIERAIKRGAGQVDGADYEEILYEGYGPGGVALMIKALTENKNRTVAEVRSVLTRYGGSLGSTNSVAFQFQERGVLSIPKSVATEEQIFECALDAGVEDIQDAGEQWEILCESSRFGAVRSALESLHPDVEGGVRHLPNSLIRVTGDAARSLLRMLDLLDENDDVQSVVANFEIDDAELESIGNS